jgi:hypothetical protein
MKRNDEQQLERVVNHLKEHFGPRRRREGEGRLIL